MQRVKRSTAIATIPAPPAGGTPGFFTGGDPAAGLPATVPGYEWYNGVQEELCNAILDSGQTLDPANNSQLKYAIQVHDTVAVKSYRLGVSNGALVLIEQ